MKKLLRFGVVVIAAQFAALGVDWLGFPNLSLSVGIGMAAGIYEFLVIW